MSAARQFVDLTVDDDVEERKGDAVTGVLLDCEDMSMVSERPEHRRYEFNGNGFTAIEFVRATVIKGGNPCDTVARATFTSPVMSRRHAIMHLLKDGTVTITDLASLHGTYVQFTAEGSASTRLVAHRAYKVHSGDVVTFGKAVSREKFWKPVTMRVQLLTESSRSINAIVVDDEIENSFFSDVNDSPKLPTKARDTPNRYGLYSPASANYELHDDDNDMYSPQSFKNAESSEESSSDSHLYSPASPSSSSPPPKLSSILPFGLGRLASFDEAKKRLPSLRDLCLPIPGRDEERKESQGASIDKGKGSLPEVWDFDSYPTSMPENQLGMLLDGVGNVLESIGEKDAAACVENELVNEGDDGPGLRSRHSSPMQISSGHASRESSIDPELVGAWPCGLIRPHHTDNISRESSVASSSDSESLVFDRNVRRKRVHLTGEQKEAPVSRAELCRRVQAALFPEVEEGVDSRRGAQEGNEASGSIRQQATGEAGSHIGAAEPSIRRELSFTSLSSKIQDLVQSEMVNVKDRIQDLKESIVPLVERQLVAAKAIAAARVMAAVGRPDSTPSASVGLATPPSPGPQQHNELQDIREEMLRFSSIMEQVLAKLEPPRTHGEQAIQAIDATPPILAIKDIQMNVPPVRTSRKRGRAEVEDIDEDERALQAPAPKRRRTRVRHIAGSVATAAGYTSLGAVAMWATLAYYL